MDKHIVFIHSLNNFTGSPNVLSVIVKGLLIKGYPITLITSKGDGFLSDIKGIKYKYTCYRWTNNTLYTLLLLMVSQIQTFFYILFLPRKDRHYYINTIIPFGAALACKLSHKEYTYHVHENMQQDKIIYALLRWVYKYCNHKTIFVSNYLKGTALKCRNSITIYNALEENFTAKVINFRQQQTKENGKAILMIASLRRFKGIYEFAEIARALPQYSFELILAATQEEVNTFISETGIINNLKVYSRQKDLHPFYQRSRLLLQLSHPESWIETFGLTILEAMYYGIPSIVPDVGGPLELIDDGQNGYAINPHKTDQIISKIKELMEDEILYNRFSKAALDKSKTFSEEKMINEIEAYINN